MTTPLDHTSAPIRPPADWTPADIAWTQDVLLPLLDAQLARQWRVLAAAGHTDAAHPAPDDYWTAPAAKTTHDG